MFPSDSLDLLERLGRDISPESPGLSRLPNGRLDLRQLRIPRARTLARTHVEGAVVEYRPGRPFVSDCRLSGADFTGADVADLIWESPYVLTDISMDRVDGRNQIFRPGVISQTTFRRADLRGTHWGVAEEPGPDLTDVDFTEADLRGSTFNHPSFRTCRFAHTKLDGIDFNGARFEDCVFEGPLNRVWFHGKGRGNGAPVRNLRNPMRNVDFSKAELRFVEFLDGVDLTACRFPERGYLRIEDPREVFRRVRERVQRWTGQRRDKALRYVGYLVDHQFNEDMPVYFMRPEDLADHSELRGIGPDLLQELEAVLSEDRASPRTQN